MSLPNATERHRLLEAAAATLRGKKGDKVAAALAGYLFDRTAWEDLALYEPEEIALFARSAAEALHEKRKRGAPVIRLINPEIAEVASREPVTLVEIVNDDMPFLLDSILGELQESGADIHLVAHPILAVERDRKGELTSVLGLAAPSNEGAPRESLMQIHIDRLALKADRDDLAARLAAILEQVRNAVGDWQAMRERLAQAISDYRTNPPPLPKEEVDEAIAFLEWLGDNNFTLLGMREYDFEGGVARGHLKRTDKPALGILRDPAIRILRRGAELLTGNPLVREFLKKPEALIVSKANLRSRVHRRAYTDYIGVKLFGRTGKLTGELRILGLFTSTAYTRSTRTIPYLRRKIDQVIARAGYDPQSHSGKALINALESYPRDELFQIDEELLFDFAMAILALDEHPRVRVLVRRDKFERYASILVFVPRDRYDSNVRTRIGDYLAAAFDGRVSAYFPEFPEGSLARVHFIIARNGETLPAPPFEELEAGIARIIRTWTDELRRTIETSVDPERAAALLPRYLEAFPGSYRDDNDTVRALADIETIETLRPDRQLAVAFTPAPHDPPPEIGFRLIHLGGPIALSDRVPMLENMGFRVIDERTYEIVPKDASQSVHVHDMTIETLDRSIVDLGTLGDPLTAAFMAVWNERADNDGFNGLVVRAGLGWRDVALLRSISRYLQQAGIPYTQDYIAATINRHAKIAATLVAFFHARFDPFHPDEKRAEAAQASIEKELEEVDSLDEDRIIRRFAGVVSAMVRTNFFQLAEDGGLPVEISFKLDSKKIEGLPAPRPFREIFIHGPRVEGIHLRFGKVARGGIRWSDRPQDFRTEILGLVKAQQVKNAVIVPVGAKGGFIPRRLPVGGTRQAITEEGVAAYKRFISNLLDITDTIDGAKIVPPENVVRHEEDDPYLVVAADKGTGAFSDIANGISDAHDFWLGDAFASGGSAGYDHKEMGITARGAWEAVKRHFRERDHDIQKEPFTVVGVGDMSGDVFGNGMLLSPATRLVAAFDHRDIFIDPDPDPAIGLAERRRLFEKPGSSWQDYDKGKISKGGGVFSRKEKSIPLTPEIRACLDLTGDHIAPPDLMRAILKARVDLLWFGGIGTFIRARTESDLEVGDRANDAVRITALDVRAPVIGEGANLGMTQKARIEFGLAGGRCNSDAIDNSAGVNTSDVEVNIKIALQNAMREGRLDMKKRNRLLAAMTDEVAALVLRNNYLQPLAISLTERRGLDDLGYQQRLMQALEARGALDRAVEFLPDDAAIAERAAAGKSLTRAEIGVLLAYAKIVFFDDLLVSDLPDDPALDGVLVDYFPKRMRKAHAAGIESHRLRREIIATSVANEIVDRGGPTFLTRISEQAAGSPATIARAAIAASDAFDIAGLNAAIDALDNKVPGAIQLELYQAVQDLLLSRTLWFLRNVDFGNGLSGLAEPYAESVDAIGRVIRKVLPQDLVESIEAVARRYSEAGVPAALAWRIASLPELADTTDIHRIAIDAKCSAETAAGIFFAAAGSLRVSRLEGLARTIPLKDRYDRQALATALDGLADSHRRIVANAISEDGTTPFDAWIDKREATVTHTMQTVDSILAAPEPTVSRITVAAGLIADLARK